MRPDQANAGPGRPEPIEELFEALESPLLSYALRLVGERSLAEDIVQEAFMRLHEHFAEVREPRRWLYRTTHNLALNQRRSTSKIVSLDSNQEEAGRALEPSDPQPFPDEQIARWEGIGLVRLSLKSLDERSRQLIELKFHENLSYKEISSRTGLTVGHVGYLLHHAIKAVADELGRNGMLP
ncbi:MAG TPA: RNA polymerase sigma factor [Verrucomicrobiae bacterium]|nr:RNA polymerase sigma factor [Verrucomicrobiae bacterium]